MPEQTTFLQGFPIARAADGRATITSRFNPAMLATARDAKGFSQASLAKELDVSPAMVGKWERDQAEPSQQQLQALAETLSVEVDFFFVDRPRRLASMSDFYHRALATAKRGDVKAVHALCSVLDLQLDRLLDIGTVPDDRIPDIDPDNHAGNVEKVAQMARVAMGVPPGPIKNLVQVIEDCGGIVIDRDFSVDSIDALCRWVPELPKLFFVNNRKPADRLRFNLAHELGHTIMHFGRDVEPKLAEDQANGFAAAFLMPAQDVRGDLRGPLTLASLAAQKRKWRTSMQALAMRARDLRLIDETRLRSIMTQLSQRGWRKAEPNTIPGEQPSRFYLMIQEHLDAGYSIPDLAKLLFVSDSHIRAMLRDVDALGWERDGVRLKLTD